MKKVSCISLAGWYSGKFSAVKLCQSSSISGPSATAKPIDLKISVILFFTKLIGCLDPSSRGYPGLVRSSFSAATFCEELLCVSSSSLAEMLCFSKFIFWPYSFFWSLDTDLNCSNKSFKIPFFPLNLILNCSISSFFWEWNFWTSFKSSSIFVSIFCFYLGRQKYNFFSF